ncbi:sensor domain-containing protein [soil metagenome]
MADVTAPTAPPAESTVLPAAAGRWRMTGYAALQLALAIPALAAFIVSVVGSALLVVWVGGLLLVASVPATRWIAQQHRRMAARVLGIAEPRPYRPVSGEGRWALLNTVARDPMTYRDLGWTVWAFSFGFVIALITVLELLVVVLFPVWWYAVPVQMRVRSQIDLWFLATSRTEHLEQRVAVLTETRSDLVDHSAAELRRLERDLHDGPQARLVALSMSLGLADQALGADGTDPEAARRLVHDARATTQAAIGELRSVVRGIHPPVLADRGLTGAVSALALDMAVPVAVTSTLVERPPAPVESALYFAVAECLANVGKHATAEHAWIRLDRSPVGIRIQVGDDGRGGADPGAGTGMLGVQRRLAAFDGTMVVVSPTGGPTEVTLEVPCDPSESSLPRTTRSSAPG